MANELTIGLSQIQFSKGGVVINRNPGTLQITVAGVDAVHVTHGIGTSAENMIVGDIGTPGVVWAYNHDATNYVELGYDDSGFVACCKVPPGQYCLWTPPDGITAPQAKANAAPILLEYIIVEV